MMYGLERLSRLAVVKELPIIYQLILDNSDRIDQDEEKKTLPLSSRRREYTPELAPTTFPVSHGLGGDGDAMVTKCLPHAFGWN